MILQCVSYLGRVFLRFSTFEVTSVHAHHMRVKLIFIAALAIEVELGTRVCIDVVIPLINQVKKGRLELLYHFN